MVTLRPGPEVPEYRSLRVTGLVPREFVSRLVRAIESMRARTIESAIVAVVVTVVLIANLAPRGIPSILQNDAHYSAFGGGAPDSNTTVPLSAERAAEIAAEFSEKLKFRTTVVPDQVNQFRVEAQRSQIDQALATLGSVHSDHRDRVGMTLRNGTHIGLQFLGPD